MPTKKSPITVYAHHGCGGCRELLPIIKKLAKKKKIPVKVVDIEKCKTAKCEKIGYVPMIMFRNKEVKTAEALATILGAKKV